jgi:DNA-binding NarL/FixJ family response regulator
MINILVVDDHSVVREGLRYLLSDAREFEVVGSAASGEEALACLEYRQVDVVLLDLFLPDSEGLKTLRLIKQAHPALAVLLFSGAPVGEHGLASLEAGAAGFVSKDCEPDVLRDAIRRAASGGRYIDPALAVQVLRGGTTSNPHYLSRRELQVMTRIARGEALTSIAGSLTLSIKTVSTYRRRILDRLQLATNADLVRYAVRHGLE